MQTDYPQRLKIFVSVFLLLTFSAVINYPSTAQQNDIITITVKENESIRDIAEKYLKNPDLWIDILRANNITTAADLKVGMTLRIPVKSISRASEELDKSKDAIQIADKSGAKIFAPALIDSAVTLRNLAIEERQKGLWDECFELAKSAYLSADKAYKICLSKKNVAGQAVVHYRLGTVQNRKVADLVWLDAPKGTNLEEREKVRTLTRSYAEILFKGESRLRLEENSQAVIQEMRVNLLENKNKAKISLIEGDFLALLSSGSSGKDFEVDVSGVETEINSTRFRIGKDENAARFANYEGEMGITAQGSKVVLKKNQGSVVKKDQKPTKPKDLLPKPNLTAPLDGIDLYSMDTKFECEELKDAGRYRFEVAMDKTFGKIVLNEKVKQPSLNKLPDLAGGAYYWRVSAIDKSDLAGPPSDSRTFTVIKDEEPPYLMLKSPQENEIVHSDTVLLSGETEKEAEVHVGEKPVPVDKDAGFKMEIPLVEGKNVIVVEALDKAKNKTRIERVVTYQPSGKGMLVFDENLVQNEPNRFLVRSSAVTLSGKTDPGNTINIRSKTSPYSARYYVKGDGVFSFNIVLNNNLAQFELTLTSSTGENFINNITIEIDDTPPKIIFNNNIPAVVSDTVLNLTGEIHDGDKLSINGNDVEISDNMFKYAVPMKPGENKISLTASDKVGNETRMEQIVLLDNKPPQLIKYDILPKTVKGGESVQIFVYAKDESGLKKAAPFTVGVGDFTYQGFLRFKKTEDRYEGTVSIPPGKSGTVKLIKITLEDIQGNVKEITY